MSRYFLAGVQFSSGCPYRCEFCDIPELYGRNPRLKTPQQVLAELDAIVEDGCVGAVYFVDDNFVGNRKAAKELLPHLIEWQKRNKYPVEFACEATLNIAKSADLLEMMREASFWTVFCGIETPDPAALKAMAKDQNNEIGMLRGGEDPEQLRDRGRVGNDHGSGHGRLHHPGSDPGICGSLADSGADHQSAGGIAAHAFVPAAPGRGTVDRGRGT